MTLGLRFYGLEIGGAGLFTVTDPKLTDRRIFLLSQGGKAMLEAYVASRGELKHRQLQFASFGIRVFKRLPSKYRWIY